MPLVRPSDAVHFYLNPMHVVSVRVEPKKFIRTTSVIVEMLNGPPFVIEYDDAAGAEKAFNDLASLIGHF